jgi:hypothetical protein
MVLSDYESVQDEVKTFEPEPADVGKSNEKLELPPYPEALLKITDEVAEMLKYKGKPEDVLMRLRHKVWLSWIMWAGYRNDKKLIELVNVERDKESDSFYLANTVVNMLDQIGRILSLTNITEELFRSDSATSLPTSNGSEDC